MTGDSKKLDGAKEAGNMSDTTTDNSGPLTTPDGRPLKTSLGRALRRQKIRSLVLIAPLLLFVLISFAAPIVDMLFRSVENGIVPDTLPRTVVAIQEWDPETGEAPGEAVYAALRDDLMVASERKTHTRLGSRLNYEMTGMSSLFRKTGRRVDDFGEIYTEQFEDLNAAWTEPATWVAMMASEDWIAAQKGWATQGDDAGPEPAFELNAAAEEALPRTADIYAAFAEVIQTEDEDSPTEEEPWNPVYAALYNDLIANPDAASAFSGVTAELLTAAAAAVPTFESVTAKAQFLDADEDWGSVDVWRTLLNFSGDYTAGYYLAALDAERTADGIELRPEGERIYLVLFMRTLMLSIGITFSCLLLGYPVAFLLSHLPMRKANLLMILVLLPFWTSLLVRTSAWKVLLQQQGVINDILVYIGIIPDDARLVMINNATGTIIAMTHILLPFMILPLYSVMKTISPSYVRAAKSLGATDWTAFWRIYFPQTVPGIGAGSVLVFILSIGYYITPELVGGTSGIFISNRIAYHISSSLNWGLAAALGTLLLVVVMLCFVIYDKIVGLDNVKLG
ncbi:ABC transporter permease [Martelella mediterranea]|uniref:Putative spermidine/putrescine transport system permease protein n=1 Tax=Martelella mediterranea TaxID=293089 RepID=A0A4R3NKE6_9HYPH|nr:putative spermidine/putrescine transport system permease protein [Martelella mediterranea]